MGESLTDLREERQAQGDGRDNGDAGCLTEAALLRRSAIGGQ